MADFLGLLYRESLCRLIPCLFGNLKLHLSLALGVYGLRRLIRKSSTVERPSTPGHVRRESCSGLRSEASSKVLSLKLLFQAEVDPGARQRVIDVVLAFPHGPLGR